MATTELDTSLKGQGWLPGLYYCICGDCGKQHTAAKRSWRCQPCATKAKEEHVDVQATIAACEI